VWDHATVLGLFTDQAYNLVLLAEDEARMLGRPAVEPEHVLLALARSGNVQRLLAGRGVTAGQVYGAVAAAGLGDDLVLGRVPRSASTEDALERAVDEAAARGLLGPSSEHVLLGLWGSASVAAVLRQLGLPDAVGLVDGAYPATHAPLGVEQVKSRALRVGATRAPPMPGPMPPAFERFTSAARRAVQAAERAAVSLRSAYVAPWHFLLGLAEGDGSVAADVLAAHDVTPADLSHRAQIYGASSAVQGTGIFTVEARDVVAQGALEQAYRHGHRWIATTHLLVAALDAADPTMALILGPGPLAERLARDAIAAAAGDESP